MALDDTMEPARRRVLLKAGDEKQKGREVPPGANFELSVGSPFFLEGHVTGGSDLHGWWAVASTRK